MNNLPIPTALAAADIALVVGALAILAFAPKLERLPLVTALIGIAAAAVSLGFGLQTAEAHRVVIVATSFILVVSLLLTFTVELFDARQRPEVAALMLIGGVGSIVLATSANLLEMALGVETISISAAVLVAMGSGTRPLEAGFKYFVLTAVTFATLLFGMSLVFLGTGSLAFPVLANVAESGRLLVLGGVALMGVGLAFKLALVPVHFGALDAYTAGPPAVVGFVMVASKLGAAVALARLAHVGGEGFHTLLVVVGLTTIAWGVLASFAQTDLRRLLAYSAVAHAGFLALGASGGALAQQTVTFYILGYGSAAILCFACLSGRGTGTLSLSNLAKENLGPLRSIGLMIGLLSLAGVPPFPGFWVKVAVLKIVWATSGGLVTALAALGGVVGVIYYLRPLPDLFAEMRKGSAPVWSTQIAVAVSAVAVVVLALVPGLAWALAR